MTPGQADASALSLCILLHRYVQGAESVGDAETVCSPFYNIQAQLASMRQGNEFQS